MINDDILVKYVISKIKDPYGNWVDPVRELNSRISQILQGFPGVGWGDLSLVTTLELEKRYIFDEYLGDNFREYEDSAPVMAVVKEIKSETIIINITALGSGMDLQRDPYRQIRPWKDYEIRKSGWNLFLRVDTVPKENGGSMYWFYNKSCLDQRW